jgi:hypothetical protein
VNHTTITVPAIGTKDTSATAPVPIPVAIAGRPVSLVGTRDTRVARVPYCTVLITTTADSIFSERSKRICREAHYDRQADQRHPEYCRLNA